MYLLVPLNGAGPVHLIRQSINTDYTVRVNSMRQEVHGGEVFGAFDDKSHCEVVI